MLCRNYTSIKHWVFVGLFLASLITCLDLDPIISQSGEMLPEAAAFAQTPNLNAIEAVGSLANSESIAASQFVQQGVDFYQAGDYQAAIEQWRAALDSAQRAGHLPNTVIVLENLARVYQQLGQLIRPFTEALEQAQVKTLVFVQDGILRSVPMAALYDGSQFLIQKYAIATTPSLTWTDPKPLNHKDFRALALGVTIGDGALGFWKVLPQVFPTTKKQRCWMHNTNLK